MKENVRQQFRSAPHTIGATRVKPRDYETGGTVEARSWYAAWVTLQRTADALEVGDILEADSGELRICKYVGFEEAEWQLPEPKSGIEATPTPGTPAAAP
ncbi:MAG TPA: hypothetical protein VFL57_16885 [Bryobacteraceae bacterium]|nr:hypothetical protein [Bryobacteraceae bacterium]